ATDFIHTEYDGVAAELVAVRPDPDRPGRDAPLPEGVVARLRFTTPPPGTKDRFDYVQFVRELPPAPERMVKQGRVVVASHRWHLTEYQPYSHTWRRVRERLRTGAPPSAVAPAPADGAPSGGQGAGQAGDWFKPDDLDPGK
ncbi:MAG: hypothetical protein HY719_04560, partial [Planctomycetes bacterium]|nr:hypothetical protein [Planctomycetota bacterium]